MESPSPSEFTLSEQERDIIKLARQFEGLKMNPAWSKLYSALKDFRDDALADIRQSKSSNLQVRSNLLFRYEERQKLIEFVDAYLEGIARARREVIRTLAELNGNYGDAAEDLVSQLEGRTQ